MGLVPGLGIEILDECGLGLVSSMRRSVSAVRNRLLVMARPEGLLDEDACLDDGDEGDAGIGRWIGRFGKDEGKIVEEGGERVGARPRKCLRPRSRSLLKYPTYTSSSSK